MPEWKYVLQSFAMRCTKVLQEAIVAGVGPQHFPFVRARTASLDPLSRSDVWSVQSLGAVDGIGFAAGVCRAYGGDQSQVSTVYATIRPEQPSETSCVRILQAPRNLWPFFAFQA